MVRMWLRRIVVGASLVLLLATVGAWVRGQWAMDRVTRRRWVEEDELTGVRVTVIRGWRESVSVETMEWVLKPRVSAPYPAYAAADSGWRYEAFGPGYFSRTEGGLGLWGFGWDWRDHGPPQPAYGYVRIKANGRGNGKLYYADRVDGVALGVPWWFLAVVFAVAPARAGWGWWRSRGRREAHQCAGCGYDLRATADAAGPRLARCPECGRVEGVSA